MSRTVVAAIAAVVLAAFPAAASAQSPAGTIAGNPLTITTDGLGALQFREGGGDGAFYPPSADVAHAGLELADSLGHYPLGDSRTVVTPPDLDESGGVHRLTSVYTVGEELEVTEQIDYTDATRAIDLSYSIRNTAAVARTFRAAEVADLYAGGADAGRVFLASSGDRVLGAVGPSGDVLGIQEQTPWEAYQAGYYGTVFGNFASGDLDDVIDPNETDFGVGVEWTDVTLSAGETIDTPLRLRWVVGGNPHVNTDADTADDGLCSATSGGCTFREALLHSPVGSIVTVPSGDYALPQGPLLIDRNLTIIGESADQTTAHGRFDNRTVVVASNVTAELSRLTLTDGHAGTGNGGGINVGVAATVRLSDAAVTSSHAWQGGGIYTQGALEIERSTISGNGSTQVNANGIEGGGIYVDGSGSAAIENSTISGNVTDQNGGGIYTAAPVSLTNVTIADNRAAIGGGLFEQVDTQKTTAFNTLFARNAGGSCGGTGGAVESTHGLYDDTSCSFAESVGDHLVTDARIGALAGNGGPTLTHALLPGSAALDAGYPGVCGAFDQRGFPRVIAPGCDVGATEANGGSLTVTLHVAGGSASSSAFTVHVLRNGADVFSPGPGDESGTFVSLPVGRYQVRADARPGYTIRYGGSCSSTGAVDVPEFGGGECVITASQAASSSPPPAAPPPGGEELPLPVAGKKVNALPKSGTVKIKLSGGNAFIVLTEGQQIPVGTLVDTRKGRVTLVAAANKKGGTAKADFYDGLFRVGQTKGSKPITELTLVEKLSCKRAGKASAAAKKKKKRRLWGDGKGKFRTKGQFSSATVRGTRWLVQDTCTTTLTRVARGKVDVQDFVKHKTVLVKAGKTYVAKRR